MEIQLNNNRELFDSEKLTVSELLNKKNFTFKMLIIKINGQVVKKENWETTSINDGDEVQVIHLISGG